MKIFSDLPVEAKQKLIEVFNNMKTQRIMYATDHNGAEILVTYFIVEYSEISNTLHRIEDEINRFYGRKVLIVCTNFDKDRMAMAKDIDYMSNRIYSLYGSVLIFTKKHVIDSLS